MKTTAPKHLSAEAKRWWSRIVSEYDLGADHGPLLLQTALEAFDRMRECQARIKLDGPMLPDRFGQLKAHPLLSTERDSRAQMMAAIKQLGLDIEPPGPVGRPPGVC
ncbi:phage terminase small subunit P27 family [Thioalkalivibrio sulfidiphilus]|uniref:phage terminase small subunit P27 family n=1 Tax=Thioalkalivibrio sulfidiphilus TaxID=1033854 RepID=UPI003B314489